MMRALFSGVSGLKSHQTRMDVIGNNIANVNTVAYKSQSMTFSEVFYQTTQTATAAIRPFTIMRRSAATAPTMPHSASTSAPA